MKLSWEVLKRKRKWNQQSIQTTVDKVLCKERSIREASSRFNIRKSTLHDKILALSRGKKTLQPKMGRFTKKISPVYEQVLLDNVKYLYNRCLPVTKKEFLKLAFDLAEAMKIPRRFNKEETVARKNFYYDFMQRHPDVWLSVVST